MSFCHPCPAAERRGQIVLPRVVPSKSHWNCLFALYVWSWCECIYTQNSKVNRSVEFDFLIARATFDSKIVAAHCFHRLTVIALRARKVCRCGAECNALCFRNGYCWLNDLWFKVSGLPFHRWMLMSSCLKIDDKIYKYIRMEWMEWKRDSHDVSIV